MSKETLEWLNTNTLIGFTAKRAGKNDENAWHYREDLQGDESNHYEGAIPVEDVERRLFNWQPVSLPLYVPGPDGTFELVPGKQAITRSDNRLVMGIFGDTSYEPHDYNEWLLKTVGNILDDSLQIGSAGLLKQGAVAWVQVEMPENVETPEGVIFRPNLLATTSFDGSLATTFKRTVTNVVCDNTHAAALSENGETFKARHTSGSQLKLAEARTALNIVHAMADDFAAEVKELCETTVTEDQWNKFLDEVTAASTDSKAAKTRSENKRDVLNRLYKLDVRCAPWKGTKYGVVQTMNTFEHHEAGTKNRGGVSATRFERNMLKAAKGEWETFDRQTVATLDKVLAASN